MTVRPTRLAPAPTGPAPTGPAPTGPASAGSASAGHRSRTARGWWLAALGGLAVLLVLLVQRPGTPPLYDGVGFPDEPYRWVQPPAGEPATAEPTTAEAELTVQGENTTAAMVASAEQGPQVALFVNTDTLRPPPGAKKIRVEAAPAKTPAGFRGATPISNTYAVSAEADGGAGKVEVIPGKPTLINMRASQAVKGWVVLHRRVGDGWEQLPTFQVGTDVYAASLTAFGEYALFKLASGADVKVAASKPKDIPEGYTVGTAPASPGASPGDSATGDPGDAAQPLELDTEPGVSNNRLWLGLGLAALILGGGLLLARTAARRQAVADGPEPGQDSEPGQDPAEGQVSEDGQDPPPGPGSGAAG